MALSARKPPTLDTTPSYMALSRFILAHGLQATDIRLAALFRVAHAARMLGGGGNVSASSSAGVEAFAIDISTVER